MKPNYMGIFFMVLAMFVFVSLNALVKTCQQTYPITQVVFFRFFFALIPYLIMMRTLSGKKDPWVNLLPKALPLHILRGIGGAISLICLFQSLWFLPFADATVLMFVSPLFMMIISGPFVGEPVSWKHIVAVWLGFGGIVMMANPSFPWQIDEEASHLIPIFSNKILLGMGLGLLSAFLEAVILLHNRILTRVEANTTIVFYYALVASAVCAVTLPFVWVSPTLQDWVLLMALGVGGGIGQYFQTLAYRYASAPVLAPLFYSALVWSVLYGTLFFHEPLTKGLIVGGALIVGSGIYGALGDQKNQPSGK